MMMRLALLISVAQATPPPCTKTAATLSHWGAPLTRRLRTKSFRLSKTPRKHDGVGQQALGAISCMVLARLEPAAYCYVNDPGRPAGASHHGGVEAKAAVYATAHAPYPKLRATLRRDNCQDELSKLCGDVPPPPDGSYWTNATCQRARREVAAEWRASFDAGPAPEGYARAVGVHVRVPEGSAALGHLERYAEELHDLLAGSNATVVVFAERSGDTTKIVRSLGSRRVVVHEGRSPLDDLRAMVHVGILAVHGSSFSVLASVLRAGPAISEHRAPIHGRYAGNTYPCQLGDSWWWSPGFGRDDCPEGGFFRRPAPRGDGDGVRTVR